MFDCRTQSRLRRAATGVALFLATSAQAFEGNVDPAAVGLEQTYSPFVGRAYPDMVLFGDLHFHTEISFDAGLIGTSLNIHDAFRVARGEKIISNTGQPVQLVRPLDFLAITEHAEMLGLATAIRRSDPRLLQNEWGKRIHDQFRAGQNGRMAAFAEIIDIGTVQGRDPTAGLNLDGDLWQEIIETVDQYNVPGQFTALSGFEWTFTPKGDNLHRVILFGDGADKTSQTKR